MSRSAHRPLPQSPCPCGSGLDYRGCCARLIEQELVADTPEQLMRSRYTAYALDRPEYLRATWHASTRPDAVELDGTSGLAPRWIGLDVRNCARQSEEWATVEFIARYRVGGRAHRLHERSRFVRDAGRWYYVDGDMIE